MSVLAQACPYDHIYMTNNTFTLVNKFRKFIFTKTVKHSNLCFEIICQTSEFRDRITLLSHLIKSVSKYVYDSQLPNHQFPQPDKSSDFLICLVTFDKIVFSQ